MSKITKKQLRLAAKVLTRERVWCYFYLVEKCNVPPTAVRTLMAAAKACEFDCLELAPNRVKGSVETWPDLMYFAAELRRVYEKQDST
jgi:hypothetical protein